MDNDNKSHQPMYMRSSVSNAFNDNRRSNRGSFSTLIFIVFIIAVISLIVWVIFFDGSNYIKNFVSGLFGPEVK